MTVEPRVLTADVEPHLIVLFGATGDLAARKLLPALYELLLDRSFQDTSRVLGVATSHLDDEEYRDRVRSALVEAGFDEDEVADWCATSIGYQSITEGFDALAGRIRAIEEEAGLPGNRAIYLAIPPGLYEETVEGLSEAGLCHSAGWTRVVVEKPFGTDLASARRLNAVFHERFREEQIYRIDHYLAKETVQNLMVFRFANPLFELGWNRDRIDAVFITVAETIGLEGRTRYFERAGILRDMVQNHLMQVLTLVAMEPPVRMDPDSIRDEKVKVLRSIFPVDGDRIVRGRYAEGTIDGEQVPGYLEEDGIPSDSTTETFAALRVEIDNWRWRGIPFYLRAGKRLPERLTQIAIRYKEPPICLFQDEEDCDMHPNVLYITLQPEEGFDLMFDVKEPGEGTRLRTLPLSFRYEDAFGPLPGAYETLLLDLLTGDQTLFVRADETVEAWRILDGLLDPEERPVPYRAGTWGPDETDAILVDPDAGWPLRHPGTPGPIIP